MEHFIFSDAHFDFETFDICFGNVEQYMDRTIHIFWYVDLYMDRTVHNFSYVDVAGVAGGRGTEAATMYLLFFALYAQPAECRYNSGIKIKKHEDLIFF